MRCELRAFSCFILLELGVENVQNTEGFRLDNYILAIYPNAAATPLLSLDKYNRHYNVLIVSFVSV